MLDGLVSVPLTIEVGEGDRSNGLQKLGGSLDTTV
jgi:hypothetical protein